MPSSVSYVVPSLYFNTVGNIPPYLTELTIEGERVHMGIDTGSAVSSMPEKEYDRLFSHVPCEESAIKLQTYTGDSLSLKGVAHVKVTGQNGTRVLPLLIVRDGKAVSPVLVGRDWLSKIRLDWRTACKIQNKQGLVEGRKERFPDVFSQKLGTLEGFEAKLVLKDDAHPAFCKHRVVPYAFRESVDAELTSMVQKRGFWYARRLVSGPPPSLLYLNRTGKSVYAGIIVCLLTPAW